MKKAWDFLSDNKIKEMLGNLEFEIDDGALRLLLVELFCRIKDLEAQNFTMKAVLIENEILDEEHFNTRFGMAKRYLKLIDDKKEKNVNFLAQSGISFVEWANFSILGKFQGNS